MPVMTDSQWQIIDKSRKKKSTQLLPSVTTYIPAKGTKTLNLKRKSNETKSVLSKRKQTTSNQTDNSPTGFIWDNQNYEVFHVPHQFQLDSTIEVE